MNNFITKLMFILLAIIAMIVLWKSQEERLDKVNKYNCAVYGYYEDCKTPLRPEDRLK